eukprot:5668063-Alexandrium_andersonii.AAC.1
MQCPHCSIEVHSAEVLSHLRQHVLVLLPASFTGVHHDDPDLVPGQEAAHRGSGGRTRGGSASGQRHQVVGQRQQREEGGDRSQRDQAAGAARVA